MSDGESARSLTGWYTRVRQALQRGIHVASAETPVVGEGVVYPSRVLRPFLAGLRNVVAPVILDLGPVIGSNIAFLGERLSCTVHIEDLFTPVDQFVRDGHDSQIGTMLATRLGRGDEMFNGVFCWDLFDYLPADASTILILEIARLLRPGGLMVALFSTARADEPIHRKYVIVDDEHLEHRVRPAARGPRRVWLSREVQRAFAPLIVEESFLLRHRQRETLFRKRPQRRQET